MFFAETQNCQNWPEKIVFTWNLSNVWYQQYFRFPGRLPNLRHSGLKSKIKLSHFYFFLKLNHIHLNSYELYGYLSNNALGERPFSGKELGNCHPRGGGLLLSWHCQHIPKTQFACLGTVNKWAMWWNTRFITSDIYHHLMRSIDPRNPKLHEDFDEIFFLKK